MTASPIGLRPRWRRWVAAGVVALVVAAAAGVRLRLLDVPLQRDEGEYAYAGQLLLDGVPPYTEAYNLKLPGIYAAYAAVMAVFGATPAGIHSGLLLVNALTTLLVYRLGAGLLGRLGGVSAALVFAFLSLERALQGVYANAEHFVVLAVTGGTLLLVRARGRPGVRGLAAAGTCFGLAILLKQHGAVFAAMGLMVTWVSETRATAGRLGTARRDRAIRLAVFAAAVCAPVALVMLGFLALGGGAFERFWFWVVEYAIAYGGHMPFADGIEVLGIIGARVFGEATEVWLLAAAGGVAVAASRSLRDRAAFLGAFAVLSVVAICPGWNFRPHYFVLLLPAASLLVGALVCAIQSALSPRLGELRAGVAAAALLAVAVGTGVWKERAYLFRATPADVDVSTYGPKAPFGAAPAVAEFIAKLTREDQRIAVLGSEPEIFFYADRRSATGFIYMYPLIEEHAHAKRMREDAIAEIEAAKPEFLVLVDVDTSWLDSSRFKPIFWRGSEIMAWFERYARGFERVYAVHLSPTGPRPLAGEGLRRWKRERGRSIEVYRRRP